MYKSKIADFELNFNGVGVLRITVYQRNRFTRDVSLGRLRLTRADIVRDMNKFVWRKLERKNVHCFLLFFVLFFSCVDFDTFCVVLHVRQCSIF
jgi:hypothetical protein